MEIKDSSLPTEPALILFEIRNCRGYLARKIFFPLRLLQLIFVRYLYFSKMVKVYVGFVGHFLEVPVPNRTAISARGGYLKTRGDGNDRTPRSNKNATSIEQVGYAESPLKAGCNQGLMKAQCQCLQYILRRIIQKFERRSLMPSIFIGFEHSKHGGCWLGWRHIQLCPTCQTNKTIIVALSRT